MNPRDVVTITKTAVYANSSDGEEGVHPSYCNVTVAYQTAKIVCNGDGIALDTGVTALVRANGDSADVNYGANDLVADDGFGNAELVNL